jgi:hypothetical protein
MYNTKSDDDSNKEWILTAHDEDGADYVGSPALFSTSNTDQEQEQEEEQEQYEIITTLMNRQNEVEEDSLTSSLYV